MADEMSQTPANLPDSGAPALLTDDCPVYHALSVHLSRGKLTTRFDDRYAVANFFLSPEFRTKFQREVPLFSVDTRISLKQCMTGREKPPGQKSD